MKRKDGNQIHRRAYYQSVNVTFNDSAKITGFKANLLKKNTNWPDSNKTVLFLENLQTTWIIFLVIKKKQSWTKPLFGPPRQYARFWNSYAQLFTKQKGGGREEITDMKSKTLASFFQFQQWGIAY